MMNATEARKLMVLANQKPDITHLVKAVDKEIYDTANQGKDFVAFVSPKNNESRTLLIRHYKSQDFSVITYDDLIRIEW